LASSFVEEIYMNRIAFVARIALILMIGSLVTVSPARVAAESSAHEHGKLPEVSHDGLHLVRTKGLAGVYVKPGANLGQYNKLAILDCFVSFKKHWRRDQIDSEHVASPKQMEEIKQRLAKAFHEVFVKELQDKGHYPVVTSSGHDVLVLRPAIINLDIEAPDSLSEVDQMTFSASAGQMTLYLELYDSVTSDILARIIDPESGQGMGRIQWQNEVTNKAEADKILKKWADILRKHLDEAHGKPADG
jgi:hypothetical protein